MVQENDLMPNTYPATPQANTQMDVMGNIYTRSRYVFSQNHDATSSPNAEPATGQPRSQYLLRYWSGYFAGAPTSDVPSVAFYGDSWIRFRLVKNGTDFFFQARYYTPSGSPLNLVSSDGVTYSLPPGTWGAWTRVSANFSGGTGNQYEFFFSPEAFGGQNLLSTFRFNVFFNGGHEHVRVMIEEFGHH